MCQNGKSPCYNWPHVYTFAYQPPLSNLKCLSHNNYHKSTWILDDLSILSTTTFPQTKVTIIVCSEFHQSSPPCNFPSPTVSVCHQSYFHVCDCKDVDMCNTNDSLTNRNWESENQFPGVPKFQKSLSDTNIIKQFSITKYIAGEQQKSDKLPWQWKPEGTERYPLCTLHECSLNTGQWHNEQSSVIKMTNPEFYI